MGTPSPSNSTTITTLPSSGKIIHILPFFVQKENEEDQKLMEISSFFFIFKVPHFGLVGRSSDNWPTSLTTQYHGSAKTSIYCQVVYGDMVMTK